MSGEVITRVAAHGICRSANACPGPDGMDRWIHRASAAPRFVYGCDSQVAQGSQNLSGDGLFGQVHLPRIGVAAPPTGDAPTIMPARSSATTERGIQVAFREWQRASPL